MPALMGLGSALLTFGPAAAIFVRVAGGTPEYVILMISSAFFYLLAMLVTSILWYAVDSLQENYWWIIMWSVTFQTVFTIIFYVLITKAEKGLLKSGAIPRAAFVKQQFAFVSGLGFGIMDGVTTMEGVLSESFSPGALPSLGCGGTSFFVISSITACIMILSQAFWTLLIWIGLDTRKYYISAFGIICHYGSSLLTLLNNEGKNCAASLVPISLIFVLCVALSFYSLRYCKATPTN